MALTLVIVAVCGILLACYGIDVAVSRVRQRLATVKAEALLHSRKTLQESIRRFETLQAGIDGEIEALRAELTKLGGPIEEKEKS